MAADLHF